MKKRFSELIVLATCVVACTAPIAGAQDRFVISGAGLLGEVVEAYVAMFRTMNPKCEAVVIGKTTGKGFQDLTDGLAQIAMATRRILPEEREEATKKGVVLGEKYLGKISLVVITNARNPINELTLEQLKQIFTGQYTNWNQCGGPDQPITVTMRAVPQTGAGVEFQKIVMGGAPYGQGAIVMSLYKDTVTSCRKGMAIGYIPTTSVFFRNMDMNGVKGIQIKTDAASRAVFPSEGVVADTGYPITIPFYLYWNTKTAGDCVASFPTHAERMRDSQKSAGR